jgi:hypothetical protein
MAEKTKLQLQIEASEKKIQEEKKHLKLLERKQTERDRKDRNHRLCRRHGYLESVLPEIINLTEEQFQEFVKNHIANKHGIAVLANFTGQTAEMTATATTVAKTQNSGGNAPTNTAQNNAKPANTQVATA